MSRTRAAITVEDNEIIVQWSREATVAERRTVFVADIIARLVAEHRRSKGDGFPAADSGNSESEQNESQ